MWPRPSRRPSSTSLPVPQNKYLIRPTLEDEPMNSLARPLDHDDSDPLWSRENGAAAGKDRE